MSKVSKVFFQNPDDKKKFKDSKIISSSIETAVVNGSGVDINYYKSVKLPSTPSFLLIARLIKSKGIREYAKAAAKLRQKYPDIEFRMAGWLDSNPDAISKEELQYWLDNNILYFYGHLSDVRPAIASCSIFILPSYSEGTPRTVLEAMSMGRPVITTDAPGCRETVVDGYNGFLVPVKSEDELVNAMLKFIEQPNLINQMGMRSRKIAEIKYDVSKVNKFLLKEMKIC